MPFNRKQSRAAWASEPGIHPGSVRALVAGDKCLHALHELDKIASGYPRAWVLELAGVILTSLVVVIQAIPAPKARG